MRTHKSLGGLFAILALAACVAGLRCKVLADLGVIPEYKIAVSGKVTDLKGSPVAGASVVARIPVDPTLDERKYNYDFITELTDELGRYAMTYTVYRCCEDVTPAGTIPGGSSVSVCAPDYKESETITTCCEDTVLNFHLAPTASSW